MARLSRLVVPGVPHHITQRGNRGLPVFFSEADYQTYKALLAEWCAKAGTEVWAYCLMPDHVHLILTPSHEDGLRAALGETHRRYTSQVNAREGWHGHLWQGRFSSFPMDEAHVMACAHYIEVNPVRAKLVKRPGDWAWSSAAAHLSGRDDALVKLAPLLDRAADWESFLAGAPDEAVNARIRSHQRTGHPLGSAAFLDQISARLGRNVRPAARGRPARVKP
ncbi:MAG: transposase [Pseudomonadota bacterium]